MTMLTPRTPEKLAPPGRGTRTRTRTRRERKAAELEARTRLAADRLIEVGARPGAQVLGDLDATRDGLTRVEAAARLERHGANVVAQERAPRWYAQLAKAYANRS
ncbi:cation-transporting P-type ATPase [Streptomyces sp. NPDC059875]|uniref:cation-transporting P-type ATPase n=1 Tax=unclassified Streptomyces TaxID=2593676 RepID=UPI00364680BE